MFFWLFITSRSKKEGETQFHKKQGNPRLLAPMLNDYLENHEEMLKSFMENFRMRKEMQRKNYKH